MNNKTLYATVFITGAAVLILEITAVRILSPIYGSSLHVLSSVLTTILTALSFGYWYGGKLSDKNQSISLLSRIIILSGLSVIILLILNKYLLPTAGPKLSTTAGPLIFSIGLFFIPAFLIGIVSPFIIKIQSLNNSPEKIGTIVGETFFWGTFGSIFGSLISGYVLVPHLGVFRTVVLVSVVLLTLGTTLLFFFNKQSLKKNELILSLIILFVLLIALFYPSSNKKHYLHESEGLYSNIKIKDDILNNRPVRILYNDTNLSSAIYLKSKDLVFPNLRFNLFYDKLVGNPQKALFLGGGGYNVPRKLSSDDPELAIDVVEIEPSLFYLAQKFFDLEDTTNIKNHTMDARVYIQKNQSESYDLIFSDIFNTNQAPPFHVTTQEFYKLIKNNLTADGILIINMVGEITDNQPSIIGSTAKTLTSIFPNTIAYSLSKDLSVHQNFIFIARNSNKEIELSPMEISATVGTAYRINFDDFSLEKEMVLTDDLAPVEYLNNKS